MPSSKAVLRDIHDLKLDPKSHHRETARAGRLKRASGAVVTAVESVVQETKAEVLSVPAETKEKEPLAFKTEKPEPKKLDDDQAKTEVKPPKAETKKDEKSTVKSPSKKDEKKPEEPAAS